MSRKSRRTVFLVLALLWMALIFAFSARDAEHSTRDSRRAGRLLGRLLCRDFDSWSAERQLAFAERVDYPVRKAAHASEYAVLAVLWLEALLPPGCGALSAAAVRAWAIAALYAVTDEWHQWYVPGRSAQPGDVAIDGLGALAGLLIAGALAVRIRRRAERNKR